MNLYKAERLSRNYSEGNGQVYAVRDVTFEIDKGEFVAIAGPSGSGKTTLLNLLGLLDPPDDGILSFEGRDITSLGERERMLLRRERIGFVFQALNLIPVLTAFENVEYFLLKRPVARREIQDRVENALIQVGLGQKSRRRANLLSGGERQRVAIARALVRDVDVVLADEPTAALDQTTAHSIIDLMKRLNRERGMTFIFSTHDPSIINAADRVVRLVDGGLV